MKTDKRISTDVEELLQQQIIAEMMSNHFYLHIANWCGYNGYINAERYFRKYAINEGIHVSGMMSYLLDRNCMPKIGTMEEIGTEFTSLKDVFDKLFEFMKTVTLKLNNIYLMASEGHDFNTSSFITDYLKEQTEVEGNYSNLITRLELAGDDISAILNIENEL